MMSQSEDSRENNRTASVIEEKMSLSATCKFSRRHLTHLRFLSSILQHHFQVRAGHSFERA